MHQKARHQPPNSAGQQITMATCLLLQRMEILFLIHHKQTKNLSSSCAAWWSWCHFVRSKQSRNGESYTILVEKQVRASKSKTPTPAIRKGSQNMMLQPTEIVPPIHPRRVPSSTSFSPWWSWWWFHRLKQPRSAGGESQRNK
jgi:hypothetical protein